MARAKKKGTKMKVNKSKFVRAQPSAMSANDVVAKAKAAGISLTAGYVYTIRSKAKAKPGKGGRKRGSTKAASASAAVGAASGVENLLRAAAAEIGLSRALAILNEQRDAVRAILGS